MNITVVDRLDGRRLDPYRSLKTATLHRRAGLFIAEGDKVIERLLASDFEVLSVLVSERLVPALGPFENRNLEVLVIPDSLATELVGFKFHAGMMACGRRKSSPDLATLAPSSILVACASVDDPENLGSITRHCAAFGVGGLILGPGCADPFSRRVIRVSMGNVFRLPIVETSDLTEDLLRLKNDHGFQLIATVLDRDAEPVRGATVPERAVILFGNEAHGLDPELVAICNRRVTIPMHSAADSLNVAVAAALILYELGFGNGVGPR
jgi:tRNA G18 (ribose-2'-O)-methylase SpoU